MKNVLAQRRMFQPKGRRFQLREEGSNSEKNVLTPRKNVPAQRMHVLTKRRNVPTQRRMFWNILPWVGTFIFGSEHSSFRLEHSSLEPKLSSLSWNILLWSQNLLPLGLNILLWVRTFFLLAGTFFLGVRTFFSGLEPSSSSSEHPTDFTCVWCWDILGFHLGTPTYPAARFFGEDQKFFPKIQ